MQSDSLNQDPAKVPDPVQKVYGGGSYATPVGLVQTSSDEAFCFF